MNSERLSSNNSESEQGSEWDSLANTVEFSKSEAISDIEKRADKCRKIEQNFEVRVRKANNEDYGRRLPAEEFEKFEDDYAEEWQGICDDSKHLRVSEQASAEKVMFRFYEDQRDLNKWSIDVYAGRFYSERSRALIDKIEASDSPSKEEDLKHIDGFYDAVEEHLYYRHMTPEEVRNYGPEQADAERKNAHNDLIKYFNHMNELCDQYGSRRFTVRSFWDTSGFSKSAQTGDMAHRLRIDRDIVEEYYANAFPSAVKKYEAKLSRSMNYW